MDNRAFVIRAAGALASLAVVAGVVVGCNRTPESPQAPSASLLTDLVKDGRPIEPAIRGLAHSTLREGKYPDESLFDAVFRRIFAAGMHQRSDIHRARAMFHLLHGRKGDEEDAADEIDQLGREPDDENVRGVFFLARKAAADPLKAHEHFATALIGDPTHVEARFNKLLALIRLGVGELAKQEMKSLEQGSLGSPWTSEARERLQRERENPAGEPPGEERRAASWKLLFVDSKSALAEVGSAIAALEGDTGKDLVPVLAQLRRLPPGRLSQRKALAQRYEKWRKLASRSKEEARPEALEAFARTPEVVRDPVLWASALSLAAFQYYQRGRYLDCDRLQRETVKSCAARPCRAEVRGVAIDELADIAARDGDYANAHALQGQAERIFEDAGAHDRVLELLKKRALFFRQEGKIQDAERIAINTMQRTPASTVAVRAGLACMLSASVMSSAGDNPSCVLRQRTVRSEAEAGVVPDREHRMCISTR